jgi:hypothetical protein
MKSARLAVYKTLTKEQADAHVDDIVQEVFLQISSKGQIVDLTDIGGLAYRTASVLSRRVWQSNIFEAGKVEPFRDLESGDYSDVFAGLDTTKPEPIEEHELETAALESVTQEERDWMCSFSTKKYGRSKRDRQRYADLMQKVRAALNSILTEIGNLTGEDGAIGV